MTDFETIYREHPDRYDELVRAEDVEENLSRTLRGLCSLEGAEVLEVGAGTGRVTRILLEAGVKHVRATEVQPAMLQRAREVLVGYGDRATFEVADARQLAVASATVDLALAGWVFGHLRYWLPDDWQANVGAALDELARVTRLGGTLVVIETLGTGTDRAGPPSEPLAEYYAWLERERGFARQTIRTDYLFASVEEAARVTGFFFGPELATRVREQAWTRIPEFTGVWSRRR